MSYQALQESDIAAILHDLRHLYRDGERLGLTEVVRKLESGSPLENPDFLFDVAYTFSQRGDGVVTICLYPNSAFPAHWRREADDRALLGLHLKSKRRSSNKQLLQAIQSIPRHTVLSQKEQQYLMGHFTARCVDELLALLSVNPCDDLTAPAAAVTTA